MVIFTSKKVELISEKLRMELPEELFLHCLRVMECAKELGVMYGENNIEALGLAGLLHDNCRHLSMEELLRTCERFNYKLSEEECKIPEIIHSKLSAIRAVVDFGVDDPKVFQAIAFHTTGRPNLGYTARILFCADKISADRNFNGVEELRKKANLGLKSLCLAIVKNNLQYLYSRELPIASVTIEFYNELLEETRGG